uniref:pyruvate decarboxylase n=1 Tax=Oryza meridionalis TaxID=40149 RepID=A0A0E0F486_9ORYZ
METTGGGGSPEEAVVPSAASGDTTLGHHLAHRLVQVGVSDVFAVPGDLNLTLLDHLIAEPGLHIVGCCNELNAGYAADGYARAVAWAPAPSPSPSAASCCTAAVAAAIGSGIR